MGCTHSGQMREMRKNKEKNIVQTMACNNNYYYSSYDDDDDDDDDNDDDDDDDVEYDIIIISFSVVTLPNRRFCVSIRVFSDAQKEFYSHPSSFLSLPIVF